MTKYKLISCDLDGTLLKNDMSVSEENLKAISKIAEKNIFFVPNTGRAFNQIPKEISECADIRYFTYSNGAAIYDKKTDTTVSMAMPKELAKQAIDLFYEYDTKVFMHADKNAYVDAEKNDRERCLSVYRMSENFTTIATTGCIVKDNFLDFCHSLDGIEMFCVFFKNDADLEVCRERLISDGRYRVTSSAPHNIEVFDVNSNKGAALAELTKMLGINMEDTVAIGDSMNDISHLSVAGLAIATENAVPELKEMADVVCVSNEEHVMKYVYENLISAESESVADAKEEEDAPKELESTNSKNKNFVLLIASIALCAVILGTVISGFFGTSSSTRIGYVGNRTYESWSGTYSYLDGKMRHTLISDSGTLHMSIKTKSGIINVTIKDSDGNAVFDKDNLQTGTYDIEIEGKAYITIEANSHKGSFVIGD